MIRRQRIRKGKEPWSVRQRTAYDWHGGDMMAQMLPWRISTAPSAGLQALIYAIRTIWVNVFDKLRAYAHRFDNRWDGL